MGTSARKAKGRSEVVTGLFRDKQSAERGYSRDEINVIMSDETRQRYYPEGEDSADPDFDSKAPEGVGAGPAIRGTARAIIGGLVGSGIPEDRAREYERGVKEGGIVLGFNPRSDEDAAHFETGWNTNRAEGVYRGETSIPVVEEELQVGGRTETVRDTVRRTNLNVEEGEGETDRER